MLNPSDKGFDRAISLLSLSIALVSLFFFYLEKQQFLGATFLGISAELMLFLVFFYLLELDKKFTKKN